jgi:hypothetical protein
MHAARRAANEWDEKSRRSLDVDHNAGPDRR